ncbi:RNA 2',3'-cyclic phosphodiesterase [Streptacidiphilus sp. NEAU-YB345]|uniref:RNA 2',3'-cyclic phosphodiesterase n=1 Tax=Streptacidiphilus fuscans TaxID=2789292 RepID=A0A931FG16_9ACTN|nr:RNA 2',3'-cyclic phosphodiesterase [Streptacidiphilus fuscans]
MVTDHPQQPPTVRLFVALAPPDDAKDELAGALQFAYEKYAHLRWNRIEDWHITLAFLGELPVTLIPLLRPALARLAAGRPSLGLGLDGGGHFDERLLWTGIEGELDGLHVLAEDVRNSVRACGIAFQERPLRPHLTLARGRRGQQADILSAAASLTDFAGRTWQAERLHLVGSNIGRGPGVIRYRDIESWRLAGGS